MYIVAIFDTDENAFLGGYTDWEFQSRQRATEFADDYLKHHADACCAIIDCREPTSIGVHFRCVGFVPLNIDERITTRAAAVRRRIFPEMAT